MSMSWSEHVAQAELLLREAAQDSASLPDDSPAWVRVKCMLIAAQAHAKLAEVKRVRG